MQKSKLKKLWKNCEKIGEGFGKKIVEQIVQRFVEKIKE